MPLVVRGIIGRSWGQGAQHSQAFHSFFMHVPGLRVFAPTTPYDAKGCLTTAIRDDNPVIMIEHRMLHPVAGHVPEEAYEVPFGKARILSPGRDITIVGISHMALECVRAKHLLAGKGIDAEVIDPVCLSPLDVETIAASVRRTGRLLAVDTGWLACGAAGEIILRVLEMLDGAATPGVARMGYLPTPCPTTRSLENLFYPNAQTIAEKAFAMTGGRRAGRVGHESGRRPRNHRIQRTVLTCPRKSSAPPTRPRSEANWRAERSSGTANEALFAAIRDGVTAYCAATSHNTAFDPLLPVVRLHEPTFGAEEINAALQCLLTTHVTMGRQVAEFERAFAIHFGWRHGVMNNSGSSANLLAIAALANHATEDRLRPGDEVIVPALSWSTTVWPLIQLGLKPVIVDIDPQYAQHRSGRDRARHRPENQGGDDRARLWQSVRHGRDHRHLHAAQPDPDRGLLRGARRVL